MASPHDRLIVRLVTVVLSAILGWFGINTAVSIHDVADTLDTARVVAE